MHQSLDKMPRKLREFLGKKYLRSGIQVSECHRLKVGRRFFSSIFLYSINISGKTSWNLVFKANGSQKWQTKSLLIGKWSGEYRFNEPYLHVRMETEKGSDQTLQMKCVFPFPTQFI